MREKRDAIAAALAQSMRDTATGRLLMLEAAHPFAPPPGGRRARCTCTVGSTVSYPATRCCRPRARVDGGGTDAPAGERNFAGALASVRSRRQCPRVRRQGTSAHCGRWEPLRRRARAPQGRPDECRPQAIQRARSRAHHTTGGGFRASFGWAQQGVTLPVIAVSHAAEAEARHPDMASDLTSAAASSPCDMDS